MAIGGLVTVLPLVTAPGNAATALATFDGPPLAEIAVEIALALVLLAMPEVLVEAPTTCAPGPGGLVPPAKTLPDARANAAAMSMRVFMMFPL